jgi:hypothetical protein
MDVLGLRLPPTAAMLQPASAGAVLVVLGTAVTAPAIGATALLPAAALVFTSGIEGAVVVAAGVVGVGGCSVGRLAPLPAAALGAAAPAAPV